MESFTEYLQAIDEATGAQVKKWFKAQGVNVKAGKAGAKHIVASPATDDDSIPAELQQKIIDKFYPGQKPGNNLVNDTKVTLKPAQWDELIK